MKLIVPAFDQHYRASATDYAWTGPGEILTIGTDDAFVGIDSCRYTTHGRVTALDVTRDEVTAKIINPLTQDGFYVPGRERQSTETRRRTAEVFGLARGFEVGAVIGVHRGRPRRHAAPTN
ncbi:hypothetical protein AR457_40045 [Streptomyces agglomeratus]|uniref:DUF7715 family protein n=1 Tax=Streptomyces agglomeratus TaxID=285458 RepID=UPI0008524A62|nr:hypothetical protein [Streptomyces agglomeratus]OEJ22084.1 hypothetical protein AR457_40045 [Streptomyces agglomeratus]OEJ36921.1 hypothetical protein BGK70_00700 [Streptomyces agglomeratus]